MTGKHSTLDGRVAVVTGGSRGLGASTARRLAADGADVVLTYRRNPAQAEAVGADVRALGRRAWVHRVDLGVEADVEVLFDAVTTDPGRVDILVLNAAATSFRPLLQAERRHIERTFAVSVFASLQCVRRAVPLMPKGAGRIVAVAGADTRTWIPGHGLLAAAKAALESMVQYLACELGPQGVTVVGISPGWMDGDSIRQMLGPFYDAATRTERRTSPLREAPTPDQIAEVVAMLCTDQARYLTGSTVAADGAGVFAFCGRYSALGGELALADDRTIADAGEAPAVPPL